MTSRERVIRTIKRSRPDRIPVQIGELFAAEMKYGDAMRRLLKDFPMDICPVRVNDKVMDRNLAKTEPLYRDGWGCLWKNLIPGQLGIVQEHPLAEDGAFNTYRPPLELAGRGFKKIPLEIKTGGDRFILGILGDFYHRMDYLRGTEKLLIDIAEQNKTLKLLAEMVFEFLMRRVRTWLDYDVDGLTIADDWGTQNALLVSPGLWRSFFKPYYACVVNEIKKAGRLPIIHSDGYIADIIEDFIEIGFAAGNFQTHLLSTEELSRRFRGRFTFYGTLENQKFMSRGTPGDILNEAKHLKKYLWTEDGGFIAYTVAGVDVPFENIEAFLKAWN